MQVNTNRLGEMLLDAGLIDSFQLESALSMQRNLGGRVGSALVKLGYLPEETIMEFIETQEKFSRVSLHELKISAQLMALLPVKKMQELLVVPIELRESPDEKILRVAMTDPTNRKLITDLQFATGCKVIPVLAVEEEIALAIRNNLPELPPDLVPKPVASFAEDVELNDFFNEDPRLNRLLELLKEKNILNALDVEFIQSGSGE